MPKGQKTKAVHWLPILEAWKKSGLTKKYFCQQNNISYKTFYHWYYKFHKPELTTEFLDKSTTPSFANFIPIKVSETDKKAQGLNSIVPCYSMTNCNCKSPLK